MSARTTMLAGRRAAEALMVDTLRVRAVTGKTTDGTTGVDTPTYGAAKYNGPGRIQTYQPFESTPKAGGKVYTEQRYEAQFPVAAFDPVIGEVIDVQAAPNDADSVGRLYRIAGLHHKTHATSMRLLVDEVPQ